MNKPLLIIISGRPGSGKSTLAHVLSNEIRCPLISRDQIKEGYINTIKKGHDSTTGTDKLLVYNVFFSLIETLLDNRITAIAESAFQNKLWLPKYELLSKKARLIQIICVIDAKLGNRRFLERRENDPLRKYFHGDDLITTEDENIEYVPPDLPVPALQVDTTNGYNPDLPEICSFINNKET